MPEKNQDQKQGSQELSGKASDQLREYIDKTGDNSTWQGEDGSTDRNGSGFWRSKR